MKFFVFSNLNFLLFCRFAAESLHVGNSSNLKRIEAKLQLTAIRNDSHRSCFKHTFHVSENKLFGSVQDIYVIY